MRSTSKHIATPAYAFQALVANKVVNVQCFVRVVGAICLESEALFPSCWAVYLDVFLAIDFLAALADGPQLL